MKGLKRGKGGGAVSVVLSSVWTWWEDNGTDQTCPSYLALHFRRERKIEYLSGDKQNMYWHFIVNLDKLGFGMGNESIFSRSIALNNKSLKNKEKEKEPMMRTTEDNYSWKSNKCEKEGLLQQKWEKADKTYRWIERQGKKEWKTVPVRRKGERREGKYQCGGHIKREIEWGKVSRYLTCCNEAVNFRLWLQFEK